MLTNVVAFSRIPKHLVWCGLGSCDVVHTAHCTCSHLLSDFVRFPMSIRHYFRRQLLNRFDSKKRQIWPQIRELSVYCDANSNGRFWPIYRCCTCFFFHVVIPTDFYVCVCVCVRADMLWLHIRLFNAHCSWHLVCTAHGSRISLSSPIFIINSLQRVVLAWFQNAHISFEFSLRKLSVSLNWNFVASVVGLIAR